MTTAAELRERADALYAQAERLDREPKDTYPEFAVIRFSKPGRFVGSNTDRLTYAAIKTGGEWFLTGKPSQPCSWGALLRFIGEPNHKTVQRAIFL